MSLEAFTVSAQKPHHLIFPEDSYFVLRHVTLEGDSKTQLFMEKEEQQILVCSLTQQVPQHTLEIPLFGMEEIHFLVKGKGVCHCVGNFEEIEDLDFDGMEGMEGYDDEEIEYMEGLEGMEDFEEEEEIEEPPKPVEKKIEKV